MNENLIKVLCFTCGTVVGATGMFIALQTKSDMLYQESVESVKKSLADTNIAKSSVTDDESISNEEVSVNPVQVGTTPKDLVRTNYNKIVTDLGYNKKSDKIDAQIDDDTDNQSDDETLPQVITSDEFDERMDYTSYLCHYFSDGVITDENYDKIENVESTVGTDFKDHFGEGDMPDVVYVRNYDRCCDYEILKDERSYVEDVLPTMPPKEE